MFLLLDDTSNRGSDASLGVEEEDLISAADQEFFSDEQPEQFQTGAVQDRQALIQKAQQNRNVEPQTSSRRNSSQPNKTQKSTSQKSTSSDSIRPSTTNTGANGKVQSHQQAVQLATSVGKQLKTAVSADGGSADSNKKSDAAKPGLDKSKLIHDATHNDPRKVIGDLADHYLKLGRKTGDALFLFWGLLTIVTLPTIIGGIISFLMFNLLLISPNTNFRITRWAFEGVLDFFGVGEVLTVVAQFGLTKIDVTLSDLEKTAILAFDGFLALVIFLVFVFIITLFCYPVQGTDGVVASLYAWLSGLTFLKDLQGFCKFQ